MTWVYRAPPYQPHGSQFVEGLPSGCCTLNALACCDIVSKGMGAWVGDPHAKNPDPASVANVQQVMRRIYADCRQHDLCWPNGAATQGDMIREAQRIALPVKDILYYAEPMPAAVWMEFLRKYVAHADPRPYPILLQVANGRALVDADTGQRDEPSLLDHAICLYGTKNDPSNPAAGGYIGNDSDNAVSNDKPVCYNIQTLAAARPISMIAFDYVTAMPSYRR